jgi:dTDP-4-amino-4,6-dideoxygalactose transaminase
MEIPVVDIQGQHAELSEAIREAFAEVLGSGAFILGPRVRELEEKVATLCGVEHGVGCASGSDALLLGLTALGVEPGDEVITTPFSFFATASAVTRLGAKAVFVDIDPETFHLDLSRIEAAVTERTRGILPVHLFGLPVDADPLAEIANRRGLWVFEDAAQAIGARYRGRPVGSLGRAAALSFYPTKNLGALGDAGMLVTSDAEVAARVRRLRVHGESERYLHAEVGINSRLDELQAAALLVKLPRLEAWNRARRDNAAFLAERLAGTPLRLPRVPEGSESVFHHFVVRAERRDELRDFLRERSIGSGVYYPVPLHLQPCFGFLGGREGSLPEAEAAAREVLALPIAPEHGRERLETVAAAVREFYGVS